MLCWQRQQQQQQERGYGITLQDAGKVTGHWTGCGTRVSLVVLAVAKKMGKGRGGEMRCANDLQGYEGTSCINTVNMRSRDSEPRRANG